MPDPVSIRVRILDREYPLRVSSGDEAYTVHLAQLVDERVRRLRQALPAQPDLTHAVLACLELTEELFTARAEHDRLQALVEVEAEALGQRLDRALGTRPEGDGATQDASLGTP